MPKTVITVDDSMSIRETVKMILASAGYQVLTAEDGITLIGKLRALPQYRFTPILMLTTETQEEKKVAGKKAGATGWIVKPFDPARILAVVQKVCPLAA